MKTAALLSVLFSSMLFAKEIPQNIIETGNKVSHELIGTLGTKLKHEVQTNGLLQAAKFCNSNALTLTEEVNLHQIEGISVKRISLKERNSANAAKPDEALVLESMHKMMKQKKNLPEYIIKEEGKSYKYYKPLLIKKELCLKCHGNIETDAEVSAFIKTAYPDDKATGYKMGDLRGAILVEIKQ